MSKLTDVVLHDGTNDVRVMTAAAWL